jgi:pyridoxamine 5'-phosphate oxidase
MKGSAYAEAMERFREVLRRREEAGVREPSAAALATADAAGRPSVRTVLLKRFDEEGFVFYSNRESRKGRQLAENPRAALCLYHQEGEEAVVEGDVAEIAGEEADAYWERRPRLSRLGAWASRQSRPLRFRELFLLRLAFYGAGYFLRRIPRPPCWVGYRLLPRTILFSRGGDGGLCEQRRYIRTGDEGESGWVVREEGVYW